MTHDLPDLQKLDPEAQPTGGPRVRAVRPGQAMDVLATTAQLREAPASAVRGGEVAREVSHPQQMSPTNPGEHHGI